MLPMLVTLDGFLEGANGDIDWREQYRRCWEQRFDRLDTYLYALQRKEKNHGHNT
jgi:hypothetical protein